VNSTPYGAGDTVSTLFVGANPRNNLRLESTFLTIDYMVKGAWKTVRSDSHPSIVFRWTRTNTILGTSTVEISWTIENGTPGGTYRINYFGDHKPIIGSITAFSGVSSSFTVAWLLISSLHAAIFSKSKEYMNSKLRTCSKGLVDGVCVANFWVPIRITLIQLDVTLLMIYIVHGVQNAGCALFGSEIRY